MFQFDDLKTLQYPLPEDIRKLKGYGDYERLNRVIDLRLADESLPEAMKTRLRLEKQICARLPQAYPYDFESALKKLRDALEGATAEELERFRDLGWVDWIYINGRVHFHSLFVSNLIKTRAELEDRVKDPQRLADKHEGASALDAVIEEMKANGGAARRFHMRHALSVEPEKVREGADILVHLPLPVEYDYVKNFRLIDAGPRPFTVAPPLAAQRTIAFQKPLAEGDVFFAEYSFETHMKYHVLSPEDARIALPEDGLDDCLGEQAPHIAFTPLVRRLAAELAGEETNPLLLARRAYDYLTKKPVYSFVRSYFTIPSLTEYMLSGMKGDCGIFALCFITLCRCMGVPARWQSSLYCAPHDVGWHDWAEFYCAPWGWLPVDVSFGNSAWHAGSALRHEFYFGNLDPFRLPAARAFQKPFDPPKKHLRYDPYDNQSGEAEYSDEGLMHADVREDCEMLAWERIAPEL